MIWCVFDESRGPSGLRASEPLRFQFSFENLYYTILQTYRPQRPTLYIYHRFRLRPKPWLQMARSLVNVAVALFPCALVL